MPLPVRLLISYVIITVVVLLSERSRFWAGVLGTAPINIPLILWVVWGATAGDYPAMQQISRGMIVGLASTVVYVVVCWIGLRQRWPLPTVLVAGYIAWSIVTFAPTIARQFFPRG